MRLKRTKMFSVVLLAALLSLASYLGPIVAHAHSASALACAQPPANLDLTTLSDAKLAVYGLPPRPASSFTHLAWWQTMIHHAKHRICTQHPLEHTSTSEEDNPIRAGNMSIGNGYTAVSSDWRVPCVANSPTNASMSAWIGLGGDGNDGGGNLVQTGTEADVDGSGNISYYAWWEDYPHQAQLNYLFGVSCLDRMYAEAYNSPYNAGCIIIEDYDNGKYSGPPCDNGYPSNTSTAEWIVERPSSGCPSHCTPGTLANFSPEEAEFTSAETNHNGTWLYVGKTSHNYAVMWRGSTKLAHPGPISSDGSYFTVYYDHS